MLALNLLRYVWRRCLSRKIVFSSKVVRSNLAEIHNPSVIILIPTRDRLDLLSRCVESVLTKTTYPNFKVVIVDNGSVKPETLKYFDEIAGLNVQVLSDPGTFNFSRICNFGINNVNSELICLLNNDTEVIDEHWLHNLVNHSQDENVGVVGSLLLYPDLSIQHAGLEVGLGGIATHPYREMPVSQFFDILGDSVCYEASAVTFACALFSRQLFDTLGGLDENFAVGLNDVDFCLRVSRTGKKNLVCVCSSLIHHESASRPLMKSFKGAKIAIKEILLFLKKWGSLWGLEQTFTYGKTRVHK